MKNLYLPEKVKILKVEALSANVKLFRLKKKMNFIPGQFVLAGRWSYGEAPFGIASSPFEKKYIEIAVRKVGSVTNSLHSLKKGNEMTLRGPFGNGFPLQFFENKDIVMVSGGCGIPPIASLIDYLIEKKQSAGWQIGRLYLIYGAATPKDILFKNKIKKWKKQIKILITVDKPTAAWRGYTGLVTNLINEIKINPLDAVAAMCGPGPMTGAIEKIIKPLGISDRRIFVSEERKMCCGIGKCQHCVTGDKYVCLDGPVFNYDEIDKNID